MTDSRILASAPQHAAWIGTCVRPAAASRRYLALPSIIATWEERKRFRCELEQMSKDNPYLIDDIGLTRRQVEAEIAKPFWQA